MELILIFLVFLRHGLCEGARHKQGYLPGKPKTNYMHQDLPGNPITNDIMYQDLPGKPITNDITYVSRFAR